MKQYNVRLAVIFCSILLVAFIITLSMAEQKDSKVEVGNITTRVAIINSAKLKAKASCFRAHEESEKMLSEVLTKMRNSEMVAKKNYEQAKNNKNLTRKEIAKSIEQIEEDWAKLSKQYKDEIRRIKEADVKLSEMLQFKLNKVISSIAKKYKIDVVLNNQIREIISVFYASEKVDITNLVIEQLNKAIEKIELKKLM